MTLRALLRWANRCYVEETPPLDHLARQTDDGGSPDMRTAVKRYLRLIHNDDGADDWRRAACRVDHDGRYVTPLRCAIESIHDPQRRRFLRDLVPELYRPSDIATLHGIPEWCAGDVMYRSLAMLHARYQIHRPASVGWVSMSESQRAAISDGEAVPAV
jgi:hypothetical protein